MDLVEKVARALASDPEVQNLDQWKSWIEDAQTVVDIVLEEREWQPIETAPKDGTKFLAFWPEDEFPFVMHWAEFDPETAAEIGEKGYFTYSEMAISDIGDPPEATHWMPLPDPPKDAGRALGEK